MEQKKSKKNNFKHLLGFGLMMFLVITFVDLVNGQEIIWLENIGIPALTVVLIGFFEWAWDSKKYGKK